MTHKARFSLKQKYPPSEPCGCAICLAFCQRPGWWTVEEAAKALRAGYTSRMMLEVAPDYSFGVLSPAFKGCEQGFAFQEFSIFGCNFLKNNLCELHDTGFQPLECRFCHHERTGLGQKCHMDLETDWKTNAGQLLVIQWGELCGLWDKYGVRLYDLASAIEQREQTRA
jgi:hypothetical protein